MNGCTPNIKQLKANSSNEVETLSNELKTIERKVIPYMFSFMQIHDPRRYNFIIDRLKELKSTLVKENNLINEDEAHYLFSFFEYLKKENIKDQFFDFQNKINFIMKIFSLKNTQSKKEFLVENFFKLKLEILNKYLNGNKDITFDVKLEIETKKTKTIFYNEKKFYSSIKETKKEIEEKDMKLASLFTEMIIENQDKYLLAFDIFRVFSYYFFDLYFLNNMDAKMLLDEAKKHSLILDNIKEINLLELYFNICIEFHKN